MKEVFAALIVLSCFAVTEIARGGPGAQAVEGEVSMATRPIEDVLKEHTPSLMSIPGVVGTAQGLCSGEPCIRVFVVEKTDQLLKQIPAEIEGYKVDVEETGVIRPRK